MKSLLSAFIGFLKAREVVLLAFLHISHLKFIQQILFLIEIILATQHLPYKSLVVNLGLAILGDEDLRCLHDGLPRPVLPLKLLLHDCPHTHLAGVCSLKQLATLV